MTPPLVIPPYLKEAPLTGLIGMGGGATSRHFYTASSSDSYQITKSVRFEEGDDAYLKSNNGGQEGNRQTWTLSYWCKRQAVGVYGEHFSSKSGTPWNTFQFHTSDQYQLNWDAGSGSGRIQTDSAFRDMSAWMHICIVWDTTHVIDTERARIYINGIRQPVTNTGGWPTQGEATPTGGWNDNVGSTWIGGGGPDTNKDALAEIYHIDGLALGPAPFGEFDTAGAWNPKTFALPTPNQGVTHSSTLTSSTGSWYSSSYNATRPFNNNIDWTGASPSTNTGSCTWTPTEEIPFTHSVKTHSNICDVELTLTDDRVIAVRAAQDENKYVYYGNSKIKSIKWTPTATGYTDVQAIWVDGVLLVDGRTDTETRNNPNNGTIWSDYVTGTNYTGQGPTKAFDGLTSTYSQASNPGNASLTFIPPAAITGRVEILIAAGNHGGAVSGEFDLKIGNVSKFDNSIWPNNTTGWVDLGTNTIDTTHGLVWGNGSGANDWHAIKMIKVDGQVLVDGTIDKSFNLKFNDITLNRYLGKDSLNGAIADATGGLPVHNTSDDYGETKGSGERTDSDSANLQLAIGNTFADVSGNSVNVSESGCVISTEQSRFYGSSIKFDGNGDMITTAGSLWSANGDQTFECWLWVNDYGSQRGIFHTSDNFYGDFAIHTSGAIRIHTNANNYQDTVQTLATNTWYHIALVQGSNFRDVYVNGSKWEWGSATGSPQTQAWHNHAGTIVIGDDGQRSFFTGYMSDIRIYNKQKYTANFSVPNRQDFTVNNLDAGMVVGSSEGGKPIRETTDSPNYGRTAHGSNLNSDDNSSYLVLAVPFNAATPADVSHTIRGSGSAKALTVSGSNNVKEQTAAKYYGSCFDFNASSHNADYISADSNSADFAFGTGAFTIEFWYRWNDAIDTNTGDIFFGQGAVASGALQLYMSGKDTFVVRWGGNPDYHFCDSTDLVDAGKTWHHFALVRISASTNQTKFFIDGVEKEYFTCGGNITAESFSSGKFDSQTVYYNKGRMQDLRVYKGVAKYKSNFIVPSNLDNIDCLTDTPTNYGTDDGAGGEVRGNFATWNPLIAAGTTFSQGNLKMSWSGEGTRRWNTSTIAVRPGDGRFLAEHTLRGGMEDEFNCGFMKTAHLGFYTAGNGAEYSYWWRKTGEWYNGTTHDNTKTVSSWSDGDVLSVAIDYSGSTGSVYLYKNGTAENSGNAVVTGLTDELCFLFTGYSDLAVDSNFGQRVYKYPVTISGEKYGAVCTHNLPDTFDDNDPSKYFDMALWHGSGASKDIKSFAFQPDLVWIKSRDDTYDHAAFDAIRGANKRLRPSGENAEGTDTQTLTAFNTDGFTVGTDSVANKDDDKYVGWCWDAGTSAATPSDAGDITPTAQWVNTTAGFGMCKYTGTFSGSGVATIGHQLGAAPQLIISKELGNTSRWAVKHVGLSSWDHILELQDNVAEVDKSGGGNTDDPTSTLFGTNHNGGINVSGYTYVAYYWTPIAGYSSFGSYTGNGSADGPFVYCGFEPAWLLYKRTTDGTEAWQYYDRDRTTYNMRSSRFNHTNAAEHGGNGVDIYSNGFKLKSADSADNASGKNFIYIAFAERPFKTARAQ